MPRHPLATLALLARAVWGRPRAAPRALRLAALRGEVTIRRDEAGVPHIRAEALADAAFGQGYAVAEDRLWQMETLRRLAGGRLAEILGDRPVAGGTLFMPGASFLSVDALYRSLRMYPVAREEYGLLGPAARAALDGYAAGVNRYLEVLRPARFPPEYLLLGLDPSPWTVEDSLAIGKLIGWLLSLAFPAKPVLAALAADPALRPLLPPDLAAATCILGGRLPDEAAGLDRLARAALGLAGTGVGSNSWALAGSRTASGKPMLCNDPHLLFGLPALWHPVALSAGRHQVMGGSMPGIPLVLIGRNAHLAWGFTAVMAEDGDYYQETLDAAGRYRRDGEWRPVESVEERFGLRGGGEARRTLRFVRHGGVLCPLVPAPPGASATSYRWTGLEPWPSLDAVVGMNCARDLVEFERAAQAYAVPAQNVVVADRGGSIAYFCAGRFPRRAADCAGAPLLDGARPAHAWQGYLEWAEHPRCVNPPEGFLVTANNRIARELPPALSGGFWEPPYRATRIAALLAGQSQATASDMAAVQTDVLSLQAAGLVLALVRPFAAQFTAAGARRAAEALLAWDCVMRDTGPAPALFHLFYRDLLRRCVGARMEARAPGLFRRYLSLLHMAVPALDAALMRREAAWFPEGVLAEVEAALAAAWAEATRRLGPEPAAWGWGRLHTLTFHHGLGRARHRLAQALVRLFRLDRGPYPRPGDGMTVNLAAFPLSEPFEAMAGPSYRQIVDLGAPEESRWVIAGGVSGDPRSPHYADQIPLWLRGEYRPMQFVANAECGMRDAE